MPTIQKDNFKSGINFNATWIVKKNFDGQPVIQNLEKPDKGNPFVC